MAAVHSPIKAIRAKCLDCSCGSSHEVKQCPAEKRPLYPFREGRNPFIQKREYTEEQREAAKARVALARLSRNQKKSANSAPEGTYIPQDNFSK